MGSIHLITLSLLLALYMALVVDVGVVSCYDYMPDQYQFWLNMLIVLVNVAALIMTIVMPISSPSPSSMVVLIMESWVMLVLLVVGLVMMMLLMFMVMGGGGFTNSSARYV